MIDDLNTLPLDALFDRLSGSGLLDRLLDLAFEEDVGSGIGPCGGPCGLSPDAGDVTGGAGSEQDRVVAAVAMRKPGVVAGLRAIPAVLRRFAPDVAVEFVRADGARSEPATIAVLRGPRSSVVLAERTLLNIVGRACGIATLTAQYVELVRGTRAGIYDTRKTTPGLRIIEKYAVRCGGGMNHRFGLGDALLIKDNHIAGVPTERLAEFVAEAVRAARSQRALRFAMVEVDSLEQLREVLSISDAAGRPDIVLLDNMRPEQLRDAVRLRDESGRRIALEASGGVSLLSVRAIAESGVERISIGSLTHGAVSLDVGLDVEDAGGAG